MLENLDQGLINTLAGVLIGGLLTFLTQVIWWVLKRVGRLKIIHNKSKYECIEIQNGEGLITSNIENAEYITLKINVYIYNQTELPRTLSNLKIEIIRKNNNLTFPINKIENVVFGNNRANYTKSLTKEISVLTIPPKDAINITFNKEFDRNELQGGFEKVLITAIRTNKTKFKREVLKRL